MKFKGIQLGIVLVSLVALGSVSPSAYAFRLSIDNADAARLFANDPKYFTLNQPQIKELTDDQAQDLNLSASGDLGGILSSVNNASGGGLDLPNLSLSGVTIDQIVNLGKQIWDVVQANKPVVDVKTDTANALPKGAESWLQLSGWKAPSSKVYQVTYSNFYGMDVVTFSFRVLYTYGGNVQGKGLYLTNVTIVPAELDVSWGFKFSAQASVPSVTNAGTSVNPVGAAQMLMDWKVDSVLKHEESTVSYYVRGDGQFKDLSNGN